MGRVEETEVTQMGQIAVEMDKTELARVIAELIKNDPEVRGAVMRVAFDTPGNVVEY